MTELTKRQETILSLIVREYVRVPAPVSSKMLVEGYDLSVSSATVRNDMAALEEQGLIYAPHTSAGRVPTEEGYRYFVQRLIRDTELAPAERRMIRHQFHQTHLTIEQWLRLAVSVLAHTVHSASLVTSPVIAQAAFKHIELINTHGRLVLMVLVLEGGDVRQQMLTLAEPVLQPALSQAAARINAACQGSDAHAIRALAAHQPTLDQEIMGLVADLLETAMSDRYAVYFDGLANILDPAHLLDRLDVTDPREREDMSRALVEVDTPGARQTLHLLEEKSLLDEILSEAMDSYTGGVQVMIGGEGRWEQLNCTSMILTRYGVTGQATGTLGILGPTRLHYGRAISTVRYVAGLMSDMMIEIYGEGDAPGA